MTGVVVVPIFDPGTGISFVEGLAEGLDEWGLVRVNVAGRVERYSVERLATAAWEAPIAARQAAARAAKGGRR